MRITLSTLTASLLFVLPSTAFAESSATLCFMGLSSPVSLKAAEGGQLAIEGVQPGTAWSMEQVAGELDFSLETFDDGVELTVDVGVELGIPEELLVRFDLIEVEHEDVTIIAWPVTDHAHIDPSYLPDKIIGRASVPAFVPGCASPLKIGLSFSEEVGLAPWEDIELNLVVED